MSRVILKYLIPLNVLLVHMLWGIKTFLVVQTSRIARNRIEKPERSYRQVSCMNFIVKLRDQNLGRI